MEKFLFYSFLVILLAGIALGVPRQLILYESETRNERFYSFTSAVPDSRVFPWMRNIQRICYRGFWYCHTNPGFHGMSMDTSRIFDQFSDSAFTCHNMSTIRGFNGPLPVPVHNNGWWTTGFTGFCGSFRPAGGGLDISLATLTLFDEGYLNGREVTLSPMTGRIAGFPPSFTVRSLAWTGGNGGWGNWTIFEDPEYRGYSECLHHNGYGSSIVSVGNMKVRSIGSIAHGCDPGDSSLWSIDRNTWAKLQRHVTGGIREFASLSMAALHLPFNRQG